MGFIVRNMNGPPMRYRAEPPRPIQTNHPPKPDGMPGWIKWLIGGGVVVILLLGVSFAMGGSDAPAPVKKQAPKVASTKVIPKPNQWKRSYGTGFAFASNPGGQPVTVNSSSVAGLNKSKSKITYKVSASCSTKFADKRRWQLLAYNPTKQATYPTRISKRILIAATCQWTVDFVWPSRLIAAPRYSELWIQIPRGRGPSNGVSVRLSVPASHRGV